MLKEITNLRHPLEAAEPAAKRRKLDTDPISIFPKEVLQSLFGFLSCGDLCRFERVSHKWKDAITTISNPLSRPVFVGSVDPVQITQYLALCKKANIENVSKMTLVEEDYAKFKVAIFQKLFKSDLKVDSLCLTIKHSINLDSFAKLGAKGKNAFKTLRTFELHFDLSMKCYVGGFLECLPALENLTVLVNPVYKKFAKTNGTIAVGRIKTKGLKTFKIGIDPERMYSQSIMNYATKLLGKCTAKETEKLTFYGFSLNEDALQRMLRMSKPKTIELDYSTINFGEFMWVMYKEKFKPRRLQLTGVFMDCVSTVSDPGKALSTLESLEVGQTMDFTWGHVIQILAHTKGHLKELSFLTDSHIFKSKRSEKLSFSSVFEVCPALEVINFSQCAEFDDKECVDLAKAVSLAKPSTLKAVTVSGKGPSEDAIQTLRSSLPSQTELQVLNTVLPKQQDGHF